MDPSRICDISAEPTAFQGLSPEQKERLTDVLDGYLSALESGVPPPREALLEAHPDLAGPLEAYLESLEELHDAAAGFGHPSHGSAPEAAPPEGDEKRLGDFQLLREIGRGGMGVVYEARQISLGRRVAVKVLPFAAVLDSRQIARFKHEAQAAAQLDHPSIVSVFAVGAERGVHYYAMQFIDGQSLDVALAELRGTGGSGGCGTDCQSAPRERHSDPENAGGLSIRPTDVCPSTCGSFLTVKSTNRREYFRTAARLGVQAAEALHAAHEQGVVHRDVKPSNLLLDRDGKLWVTDFGLARCRADSPLTRTGDILGTVRYMSPEQAAGQTALVDHRSDIYSLGVTLYELLALQPAFPGDDGPALLRRIDQQEPRRLRQLQPQVPADLETVVLKAMSKRREDRYATARDLADDLRRVLDGKPTLAKPPTMADRLGKWAHRHKRLVAAAAAVCMLAVLGMAAGTLLVAREKMRTEENFQRAEKHFRGAREAVDRFGVQLADRLADVPGADHVRRELLQETLRYYRDFVQQAKHDPALRADLALTYGKIGTLAGQIGSNDEAVEAHQNAVRLLERLAADHPYETDYRRRLAVAQNNLGLALGRSGRTDAAGRAYGEAIRLQKELAGRSEDAVQSLADLALSYNNLGLLQSETSHVQDAESSFREAIRLQERVLSVEPDRPERLRNLAASLNNLGSLFVGRQPARAAEWYEKALTHQTRAAAARPGDLKYQSDVALTCNNLGAVQSRIGGLEDASTSYGRAIAIQTRLAAAAPAQKSYRRDLAVSCNNLGLTQSKLRRPADAERSFRQALEMQEALVRQDPHDVEANSSLGGVYNNLGIVLEELQRSGDAAGSYEKAIERQRAAYSHAPKVSRYRTFLSKHYYNYGRVLRRLGRAEDAMRAALARRDLWPDGPQHLVAVAEELALAAKLPSASAGAGATARQCADLAVQTLRQAAAAGWKPADSLRVNPSFAALKDHPGLAELWNN